MGVNSAISLVELLLGFLVFRPSSANSRFLASCYILISFVLQMEKLCATPLDALTAKMKRREEMKKRRKSGMLKFLLKLLACLT